MHEQDDRSSENRDSASPSATQETLRQSSLVPLDYSLIDRRVLLSCLLAILLGVFAAFRSEVHSGLF